MPEAYIGIGIPAGITFALLGGVWWWTLRTDRKRGR